MILVTDSDVRRMVNHHLDTKAVVTLLGSRVDDPTGLGRVRLGASGQPIDVLEEHEADTELLSNNLINTSWYCFDNQWIWDALDLISPAETGELYLPKVVGSAANVDRSQIVVAENPESGIGINDRVQLAIVEKITRNRTNQTHMANGVTLQDPENTYIDIDVQIGPDTEVRAGAHIGTRTSIGSDVIIGPNTQIYASQIGNFAEINGARIVESVIGEQVSVGPNSLIRDGSNIMLGSRIGNQAEIKNSIVGAGSRVSHFSYVGDATLGENVNIGAGTVTCNYDGNDKHLTVIEDDVFVGSGTMLIAPIIVGKAARTGAGSVIRTDVAAGDKVAGVPAKSIKSK
jgi:bifunctional UDP-N-acetylglucosamine pyrophosphorylase/glucosamine-1-phosphate N-acetyltransferase